MMVSPPGSPEGVRRPRPQSVYSATSPEMSTKSRPQSMIYKSARSDSRMSASSKHGLGSRSSDDDGKTSVRVAVRVRPPLQPSDPGYDLIPQRFQRSTVHVTTNTSLGVDSPLGRKLFIFDRVFDQDVPQLGVWDYLQDSVDSFLQGYNVSILAYGQSGAGKSYTMGTAGPSEQGDVSSKGVIPRAAAHLFENLNGGSAAHGRQLSGLKTPTRYSVGNMSSLIHNAVTTGPPKPTNDKDWQLSATYVEIYNEQPRDLLLPESTPANERATVLIREDARGRIYVEGLRSVPINSIEDLLAVLNHGSAIRQTDATAINAKSSRSHAVFTLNLRQMKATTTSLNVKRSSVSIDSTTNGDSSITVESKLHFVDLAGSERMKNTGATGDRAKEGISINAGLASLGKVISQLSSRSAGSHVSYRDSKLTRMLQDSLGGNAITYMIACVTPAEFHLSETLNTVQYAQRARNIQSKPKIQHVSDDGDKQATIDRLRTEVAFLRQQIRSAGDGERRAGPLSERTDRPNEREVELQNQLLDVQESYTTLSQRHARLVSELTKSGVTDAQSQNTSWGHAAGETAVDRLKRSQANQEQIEQVVLEYEMTIRSLEANLSNTRSSLSNTESSLLERETKCAYVETVNQQLHSRLQKLMDRESSTETYVRTLESKVDGHSTGEDKNNATIMELRKELGRIRESEVNAEDYISTLEERLAEADQDMELMQREVERLEHVVERQRSLGKLDNLLYELDHTQQSDVRPGTASAKNSKSPNGVHVDGAADDGAGVGSDEEAALVALPKETEDEVHDLNKTVVTNDTEEPMDSGLAALQTASSPAHAAHQAPQLAAGPQDQVLESPAQSRFVAEKFESVSQELFDLRLEHESTVNELDLMSAKYHEALRTLAEMQDAVDEARHQSPPETNSPGYQSRPNSFLADARINELKNGGHLSSSRSLSSELSLAGESPVSTNSSEVTASSKKNGPSEVAYQEVDRLQSLLAEHERGMNLVTQQYAQLQAEHQDTLSTVESLKSEMQSNREKGMSSPIFPGTIRRISSHAGTGTDRGHRSVVALRTIMTEELEDKPDRFESAELHLNSASQELQIRMERIQSLESELKTVKKEMDMKSTIIAGLTRERNSLKVSSPVDLSMVSQMCDQLIQKETELKTLHEGYAQREEELQREIQKLSQFKTSDRVPSTPEGSVDLEKDEKYRRLQSRFDQLTAEHNAITQAHRESESKLTDTMSELEAAVASLAILKAQQNSNKDDSVVERAAAESAMQKEREHYQQLIINLKQDLEDHRAINETHMDRITELESQNESTQNVINHHTREIESNRRQIAAHKDSIAQLEREKEDAQSAVEFHKHGLRSLHEAHANTIEEMKLTHAGQMAEIDEQFAQMASKHEAIVNGHKLEAAKQQAELQGILAEVAKVLGHPTSSSMLVNHVQDAVEERNHVAETNKRLVSTNAELERQLEGRQSLAEIEEELEAANNKIANYKETIRTLANEVANHEETIRDKNEVIRKRDGSIEALMVEKQKKISLIEELEQQLQSSFDQHHNRLSVVQAQGSQALSEAQLRIAVLEKDLDMRCSLAESEGAASRSNTMKSHRPNSPQATDGEKRTSSLTSNLRKSNSVVSLPSPPPSVPLPPLPSLPGISLAAPSNANPSPPQSRHTSKEMPGGGNSPVPPVSPIYPPPTPTSMAASTAAAAQQAQQIDDLESRLRTIEKHLHAEKQLTATLEEALMDLETQSNKLRADAEVWKKKAWQAEEEVGSLRKERKSERLSVQVVEEEKRKRTEAEAARAHLEERMRVLSESGRKKKKAGGLNCF